MRIVGRPCLLIFVVSLLFTSGGCASTSPFKGQPVEQLTIRFNADLTHHWGEYRLIRADVMTDQCLWQLYTDGDLDSQGNMRLPEGGLNALFVEARHSMDATAPTTQRVRSVDADERSYVLHLTYETQTDKQETQASGSLDWIAMTISKSPQLRSVHEQLLRKLPQGYWFAHLDQREVPEWSPPEAAQAQAR